MSTAPVATARPFHLSEAQRRLLLDLIAAHPGETIEGIRRRFAGRAGRTVGAETVRVAWVRGYARPGPKSHLSEGQRATLEDLCAATPRGYGSVPAIARRFFEATGRGVDATTVRACRRRLPPRPIGRERAATSPAPGVPFPTQLQRETSR